MKYLSILLLFLSSCYTQKKALNQLEKAKVKYPALVAEKNADWFPLLPTWTTSDSTGYKLYLNRLDSLNRAVLIQYDTIHDSLIKHINTNEIVYKYNTLIKQMPSIRDTVRILDMAKMEAYELRAKEHEKKLLDTYRLMYKLSIAALIMLLILFIIAILKK